MAGDWCWSGQTQSRTRSTNYDAKLLNILLKVRFFLGILASIHENLIYFFSVGKPFEFRICSAVFLIWTIQTLLFIICMLLKL